MQLMLQYFWKNNKIVVLQPHEKKDNDGKNLIDTYDLDEKMKLTSCWIIGL